METLFAIRHSLFAWFLRLQRTLRARINRIERGRAANIEPVALLAAEAEIGDGFRNMDLADQVTVGVVAANAVLFRVAPAHGAPDIPVGVAAHAVGKAGREVL